MSIETSNLLYRKLQTTFPKFNWKLKVETWNTIFVFFRKKKKESVRTNLKDIKKITVTNMKRMA